jgi:DNA gyrase inhibitor GyrI
LSLRTCKADVCVGLEEGKEQELDAKDKTWRISGKYAVVSFVGKD